MAFTRYRKRRFRRRTGRYRTRRFIRKIRRISRATIRRMSEVKWATAVYNDQQQIPNLPSFNEISPIVVVGTEKIGKRIGNNIKYKFITFNGMALLANNDSSATGAGVLLCRAILFSPRIHNPSMTDLTGQSAWTAGNIWLPINGEYAKVWKDWKFTLTPIYNNGLPYPYKSPSVQRFQFKHKLGQNVTYRASVTEVPQDPKDRFYFLWGFVSSDISNTMIMNHWTRISYTDI